MVPTAPADTAAATPVNAVATTAPRVLNLRGTPSRHKLRSPSPADLPAHINRGHEQGASPGRPSATDAARDRYTSAASDRHIKNHRKKTIYES